jgi:hypothetical protein
MDNGTTSNGGKKIPRKFMIIGGAVLLVIVAVLIAITAINANNERQKDQQRRQVAMKSIDATLEKLENELHEIKFLENTLAITSIESMKEEYKKEIETRTKAVELAWAVYEPFNSDDKLKTADTAVLEAFAKTFKNAVKELGIK